VRRRGPKGKKRHEREASARGGRRPATPSDKASEDVPRGSRRKRPAEQDDFRRAARPERESRPRSPSRVSSASPRFGRDRDSEESPSSGFRRRTENRDQGFQPRGSRGGGAGRGRRSAGRRDEAAARGRGRGRGGNASPKVYVGRVQKNQRGFAFLIPQEAGIPDAYLPKDDAGPLLNGDLVEFSLHREGRRPSARLRRVLERGQTTVVGRVRVSGRDWFLDALDGETHYLDEPPREVNIGDWIVARFDEYPSDEQRGYLEFEELLGAQLLPRHDKIIAISRFNLPSRFPGAVMRETLDMARHARSEATAPDRRDLRALPFVTIDGADAKDFDDAILVECPAPGKVAFILYVAIADVSFFVRSGTRLDREALERGTSVYFPGTVIPMLPESLSNDLCSLRPREERLALTAEIHYDGSGNVLTSKFYEAVIQTAARLTYEQVQGYLDKDPATLKTFGFLDKPLSNARQLYLKLRQLRRERGVLDFDLPECQMTLNEEGMPIALKRREHHDSHKLIEEFMIAANQAVARELREANALALYRVHEAPDPSSLDELNNMLKSLGIAKPLKDLTPQSFARVLESTAELKGAATLHQFILRLQKQARYEPNPRGHFGLALVDYAHFTSPIRRYPDLVVHRALKQVISGQKSSDNYEDPEDEDSGPRVLQDFEELGLKTSERERRAMTAERFVMKRKQCWFMRERLGEHFDGVISGVISAGVFVEIPELALDGFVPLEQMDGFYEFDDKRICLRKRHRKASGQDIYSVGDPLPIEVIDVSVENNEITFAHRPKPIA